MEIQTILLHLILKIVSVRWEKGEEITMAEWVHEAIIEKIRREPTF